MISWKTEAYKVLKFCAVGGFGFLFNLGGTYVLTQFLGLWYFWSFLIANIVSWTFIFFANLYFTFDTDERPLGTRYIQFLLSYLSIFWINAGAVFVLTTLLGTPYVYSLFAGTVLTTICTFLASRLYIFETWRS